MSNLASILEDRLKPEHLGRLRALAEAVRDSAADINLVGGAVRDLVLGRPLGGPDLDISVSGLDDRLALVLANAVDGRLKARSQFNTFKIEVDSLTFDVAMTRQESYAQPGALPDVRPGSVEQDLARRDFTVNAMAVNISAEAWGELLDPFDGRGDLERRIIRVLHQGSFRDDATRIFRAIRYGQRLGFRIEEKTADLLQTSLGRLDAISGDRLRREFQRVFDEVGAGALLSRLKDLGVLRAVFGPLERRSDAWPGEQDWIDNPGPVAWLAVLACGLSTGEASRFTQRLKMDSNWAAAVRGVGEVERLLDELGSPAISNSRIYHLLHKHHADTLLGVAATHATGSARANIELYLHELRGVHAELTGKDLIALGAAEGPAIGRLLDALLLARLDGEVTDIEGEKALVRRAMS